MALSNGLRSIVRLVMRVGLLSLIVFLSGCVYVPPVWDAGDEIYDLDFIEPGVTTKDQVLERLGEPDLSSEGVAWYRGAKSAGVLALILPAAPPVLIGTEEWIVTIVFDENDVVSAVRTHTWKPGEYYAGDVTSGDVVESKRRADFRRQLTTACGGNTPAQYIVAQYYDRGEGIERDKVEAFKWYSLAEPEWPEAIRYFKDKLRQEMTLSEIAEAERLAAEWKPNQAGCDTRTVGTSD